MALAMTIFFCLLFVCTARNTTLVVFRSYPRTATLSKPNQPEKLTAQGRDRAQPAHTTQTQQIEVPEKRTVPMTNDSARGNERRGHLVCAQAAAMSARHTC